MEQICPKEACTGCGLCMNQCPVNAIKMVEDSVTGHYKPVIDNTKCINCKKCLNNCPSNNEIKYNNNIITYAACLKNENEQKGSSSGGIAYAFYKKAFGEEWSVFGAVMDSNFHVYIKKAKNIDDINLFRGSKYVQSDTKFIYNEIKEEIIKKNKNVLFIGLPCQCEAVRRCVKGHNQKLLTVDLVCHGVPSQKLLKDYIKMIEKKKNKKITSISFRSNWGVEMIFYSGDKIIWKRKMTWDYYLNAFSEGIIVNNTCFNCRYACNKRASDITIGDFWGIDKDVYNFLPKRMISLIGVNTQKGTDFLENCTNILKVERSWDEAVKGNSQLQRPMTKSNNYDLFWEIYKKDGLYSALNATVYKKTEKKYRKEYPKIWIKQKIKSIIKK